MNEDVDARRTKAEHRMDRAWIAGLIHALIFAALGGLIAMSVGLSKAADFIPFGYGLAIALLSIGTHRRSRVAAAALLLIALLVEGGVWWKDHSFITLLMVLVFCPLYAFGLWGALTWHRLTTERNDLDGAPAT
jgi:hypothetical protein